MSHHYTIETLSSRILQDPIAVSVLILAMTGAMFPFLVLQNLISLRIKPLWFF